MWTRCSRSCSSSGSSPRSATARPTSTWTSSPTGARRSSSTSTRSTAGEHTAQVANVISYRPAVGGARHGQGVRLLARASRTRGASRSTAGARWPRRTSTTSRTRWSTFANELQTFPRHLGIHSGGMVICDRPVIEVCPVEWARMPNRTVLQWDKDDCAAIDLVKFDLLGLGMLSALHYAFDFDRRRAGPRQHDAGRPRGLRRCSAGPTRSGCSRWRAARRWPPCPGCKPREFYDLVVEVALIRPGPDPGRLGAPVHPPQERAGGADTTPHPLLENALEQDPRRAAVPGAADADGDRRRRLRRRRGRRAAPGDGLQAVARSGWPAQGAAVRRDGRRTASPASWPTTSSSSCPRSPTTASRRATR